ncbi:hypothetical protein MKZ38_001357 [Zalerion maritima]|uniref:Adenylate kinase n=1 Tax=Zalerion maritima TaxID=339359 RepID=A0AAD5WTW4_9PEZI|nr:hypothetical protein MKZ38_001357 [Zalerion maritima]
MDSITIAGFGMMASRLASRQKQQTLQKPDPLIICILGAPGVGKGTQSSLLASRLSLTHLSWGDLSRAEHKIPGSVISKYPLKPGREDSPDVPDDVAASEVRKNLEMRTRDVSKRIWLVDGFPRRSGHWLEWWKQLPPPSLVLHLHCDKSISLKRVNQRSATSGRRDDQNPDTVVNRIDKFAQGHDGILPAIRKLGLNVASVNTDNKDVERVYMDVLSHIKPVIEKYELENQFPSAESSFEFWPMAWC